MARTIVILSITVLTVAVTGFVHGVWTDRWEISVEPRRSQARLERVPLVIGDWDGREMEIDFSQIPEEISGKGFVRRYVNRTTGAVLTVYLTCGRPGHISIHTPLVCYPGNGYTVAAPPARYLAPIETHGQPVELWQARFNKTNGPVAESLRIFWSWSATGTWHAPDWPRVAFAKHPVLYKLYVIHQLVKGDAPVDTDPSLAFLKVAIPALDKALFAEGE